MTGRRSTKFGVKGNTRYVLVPVLSLLEIPRSEILWTSCVLKLTCSRWVNV